MKRRTWWLRISAVIFGLFAAAVPTVSEITRDAQHWYVRPGIATILGLLAGTMVLLDRLIGASSAWMRYTIAETSLKELREELDVTYLHMTGEWRTDEPTVEQTLRALAALHDFLKRGNDIVREETRQWKEEFQSAIQLTEEFAKTAPRPVVEAVAVVQIVNPEVLDGPWRLSVNGGTEESVSSDSRSIRSTPGAITARITATIRNKDGSKVEQSHEVAEVLAPGAPKILTVTFRQN
jgi:hypothetical protein